MNNTISQHYLKELNAEYKATQTCLERIPESLFEYKPHPKSMNLGYLAMLVAEIPLWIKYMINVGETLSTHRFNNGAAVERNH